MFRQFGSLDNFWEFQGFCALVKAFRLIYRPGKRYGGNFLGFPYEECLWQTEFARNDDGRPATGG